MKIVVTEGGETLYARGATASILTSFLDTRVPWVWMRGHMPNQTVEWWQATLPINKTGRQLRQGIGRLSMTSCCRALSFSSWRRRFGMTKDKAQGYELRAEYLLNAPCAGVWRSWTESKLLEQWFHPESWRTEVKALELRSGGATHLVMHGPNGEVVDGVGVFLEVVAGQRLAFTNAYTAGWIPANEPPGAPLRTMIIEMTGQGGKTRYVVRALHWSEEARKRHEEMGFHPGWTQTSIQLEALAGTL